jgi:hypothetical protein
VTGGRDRSFIVAALALVAGGCAGPSVVNLSYQHGTYTHKVAPVRVGVYYLDDERPAWPATAAVRMFDGSHGQGAGMRHTEGEKDMNVFVAESLRSELAATGMKVSASPEFNRRNVYATADGAKAASVDRVVMGRINYFGFVGPVPDSNISPGAFVGGAVVGGIIVGAVAGAVAGYTASERQSEGVAFDSEAPGSKAYVDIDLWVAEPSTGKILWASTARGKRNSGIVSGAVADRIAVFLPEALYVALREVIWRADFLAAMNATVIPAKAPAPVPPTPTPAHEQNAKKLFQSELFAEAAVEFQKAYQASGDPALLFNMALCYRRSGNAQLALAAYEEYLRKAPNSPQRPEVEERIKELRRQLSLPNQPDQ